MGVLKKVFGGVSKIFKPIGKMLGGILGLDTRADRKLYEQQERQLKQAQEARKLDSLNEVQNVVQFDSSYTGDPIGSDVRRKKKRAGALSSGLGLQV